MYVWKLYVVTHAYGIVTRENQEKEIERQVP